MKPFQNAYEAIKRLIENIKKSFSKEQPIAENEEPAAAEGTAEAAQGSAEDDHPSLEEVARRMAEEEAKAEAEAKARAEEAAAKRAAEAAAKNASGEAGAKKSSGGKKAAGQKVDPQSYVSRSEADEQKAYEEEVKRRAERAAKRERAEQKAARREMEAQQSSGGKVVVDPVTGEEITLGSLPAEAIYLKKYLKLSTTGDDILVAMNSIVKHPDMPKNIVVLGRNGFGTVKVGEDFARSFYATGLVKSDKIAKIKAKQLNKIGLEKLEGLKGGCLIIENAGLVNPSKLVEVIKNSNPDENDYVVILTGEIDSLAGFFEDNQDIVDYFIYLIDIHKIKERGMITLAKGYVKEKGYKADKAVFEKLKGTLQSIEVGNIDRFIEVLDNAIVKCDDREKSDGETGKKEIQTGDVG